MPDVYELDTSDLDKWNENVFEKALEIFNSLIEVRIYALVLRSYV